MWNHKFSPEVSHLWQWVPLFTTIFGRFWWGGLRMSHDVTYSPGESQYFAKSSFCTRLHEHQAQLLKGTSMEALPSPLKSPQILKSYCFLYIPWYPMISCNISVYIYTYCGCWNPHPQLEHCWSPGTIPAKENGSTGGTGWLDFWNLSVHVGSLLVWMKIESYLSYSVSWINPFHFYIHCVSPESSSKFEEPCNPQNEAEKYLRRSSSFRWCVPHNVQVMYFQLGVAVTVGHHQSSLIIRCLIMDSYSSCQL